jgi:hypothetical protein
MRRYVALLLVLALPWGMIASAPPPAWVVAQEPTPTVAPVATPDLISTPFVVALDGPTKATAGFAVTVTKPAAAVCRWRNELPEGSMPLELTDNAGRTVLCFFSPAPGVHRFHLAAQLPVDGLDPFAEAMLVVEVGGTQPAPPGPAPVDPSEPGMPTTPATPDPTTKATAATYVYEKDTTAIPAAVMAGLNRLNREKKIIATVFEQDTTDGTNEIPEQYKAAVAEAKKAGLPCLVVLAGANVLGVVKAPTTVEQVWEAVK